MKNKVVEKTYNKNGLNIHSYFDKTLNECFFDTTLENGFKIYFIKKEGYKNFECSCSVKYGSMYNSFKVDGELKKMPLGIAHFLEHMKFKSEDNISYLDKFDELTLGINAYTNQRETCYYFNGSKNFYVGLDMFIDFLFTPYFTDDLVSKESEVIIREYYENYSPETVLDRELEFALLKDNDHKYDIIGTPESIKEITKDDLYYCYNTFYVPSNMKMYVIGDFDSEELFACVKNKIESREYPSSKKIEKIIIKENNQVTYHYKEIKWGLDTPKVAIGIKLDYIDDKNYFDYYKRDFYTRSYLLYNFNYRSTFFKKMFKKGLFESRISCDYIDEEGISYIYFCFRSNKPDEAINAIFEKFKELKDKKNPKSNYFIYFSYCYSNFFWEFDDLSNELANFSFYNQENFNFFELLNYIKELKYEECLEYNKKMFDLEITDSNSSIVIIK